MKKKNSNKVCVRNVIVNVKTQEEKDILNKALEILDREGFTIAGKRDFVFENEIVK